MPWPWNLVGFLVGLVAFVGEVAFWHRKVRGQPRAVGPGRLVGKRGVVVSACFPEGQARIDGAIWAARCGSGADVGETVWVVGLEELTLIVERRGS